MGWQLKRELFAFLIIGAVIVLALTVGPALPELVPSHFNVDGNADAYLPRTDFLWMIVGITIGLYALLTFLPFVDPFWKRIRPRYHLLLLFRDFTLAFVLVMFLMTFLAAEDGRLPLPIFGIALGVLFALMGNYLPKVPRNWFFGIRNPWTLASEVVWEKTHVLGGWMFVATGVLMVLLSLAGVPLQFALPITLGPTVLLAGLIYPYVIWRQLQKNAGENHSEHF